MNAGDGKLVEGLDEVIASSTESIELFLADAALHVLAFIHTWHRELHITLGGGREGHLHLLALHEKFILQSLVSLKRKAKLVIALLVEPVGKKAVQSVTACHQMTTSNDFQ